VSDFSTGQRVPRSCVAFAATTLLVACVLLFPTAPSAQTSPASTDVTAVMPALSADITPGLCAPGDTPSCVGPELAQIHMYSLACVASGTFEGKSLAADSPCGMDLSAFMAPSLEGLTKPSCLTSHTYTSDSARAFGKPVNRATAGGVARKIQISYPAGVLGFRTATGWMDGPDRDDDPVGDHSIVFSVQARPRQTDAGIPCITTPFTAADLTAVMRIFDDPPGTG
jgi:hypothetical protein